MVKDNLCPYCFGTKEIVTKVRGHGYTSKECTTCDDDGHINDELLDIIEENQLEYEEDVF